MKRRLVLDAAPPELGLIYCPQSYKQVAPNGAYNPIAVLVTAFQES